MRLSVEIKIDIFISPSLAIINNMYAHAILNKNKMTNKGITKLNALLLVSVFVLSLVYAALINGNTLKSYAIRDAEKRLQTLRAMSEKIELELAEIRSIEYVKTTALSIGLVTGEKIEYIKADTGVAVNR